MKTARRHELKENDLAHYLETAVDWTGANAKLIVLGIVGVCAVVAAWFYFQQRSKQNASEAWDVLYKTEAANDTQKLQQFVTAHKNTAAGQLANLSLADIAFEEGIAQMSVDRAQAISRVNEAKNRYFEVEQAAEDGRIEQRALLGMGRCFETVGDEVKAKEYYEKLAKFENGLFRQEAERKLEDLSRPANEEFVKWYSALAPKPQAAGTNPLIQSKLGDIPAFPGATSTPTAIGTATPAATGTATATGTPTATTTATGSTAPAAKAPTGTATASPTASATATGTAK
jgi:hypothetical protein